MSKLKFKTSEKPPFPSYLSMLALGAEEVADSLLQTVPTYKVLVSSIPKANGRKSFSGQVVGRVIKPRSVTVFVVWVEIAYR